MTSANLSNQRTKEQKRAEEAWNCIETIEKSFAAKKDYRRIALKLPSFILANGLGQTLAFLKSKGKGDEKVAEEKVYLDLQRWLTREDVINWGNAKQAELMERITSIPSGKYRLVTAEALSFLNWLKRFADARLPKDEGQ